MQEASYALVGLLEDVLLPGEEREFGPPVMDVVTLEALQQNSDRTWVAVSVTSPLELPLMASSRWATECRVLPSEGQKVRLQGLRRVRLGKAQGKQPPYEVVLQDLETPEQVQQRESRDIARKLAQIFWVLAEGAWPELEGKENLTWLRQFPPLLMRELLEISALRTSISMPSLSALESLMRDLAQHRLPKDASHQLEELTREWLDKPAMTEAMKRKLWSQLVAIQRRIDLYDPEIDQQDPGDELTQMEKSVSTAGLPTAARQMARRQLRNLRAMSRSHHDYSVFFQHLHFLTCLPWHLKATSEPLLQEVQAQLEQAHTGLEKPKKRILEYLAMRTLGGQSRNTVLCLVGPPGTGKTSIAKAIAEALSRPFVRVALGGVHDESELRGHRMSFVAAAPGRILDAVNRAGSASAVVLLDEIDKISNQRQRSPEAALLEILDPEQHHAFRDNYLGVPYDLSHIFFLCTANDLQAISEPLRDRLEIIELDGYLVRDKLKIAQHHMLPRLQSDTGLPYTLQIDEELLQHLIEGYTREAGVRQLRRHLEALYRHHALQTVEAQQHKTPSITPEPPPCSEHESTPPVNLSEKKPHPVSQEELEAILGSPRYRSYSRRDSLPLGMAQGLSVLAGAGQIIVIEVGLLPGQGQIHATGSLGEVMRESSQTVWTHIKMHATRYQLSTPHLQSLDMHLHIPQAAQPKEGPSAGLALFAALLSALQERPLAADIALSGECTLSGEVLPVGGVHAKVLAAERAGLKRICLPTENQVDIPKETQLQIHLIREVQDILPHIFGSLV